ncbi:MAG: right-handed parallel beta-helix repeat-containing protein [Candidatus Eisenbacteria bacterium]|nr:right-handed parallel beta-helix repeat-containing protein [Candidatus Eisenbacteria bacterium]
MSRVLIVCAVAAVFLLFPAVSSPATTYLVKPDGTGDRPNIQAAVDAASNGSVIELADGTYTGYGNRDISFQGKAITIRSVSGDPEACNLRVDGEESDPHRGFLFVSGEGADSVLEGIGVRNGFAYEVLNGYGGAILISAGSSPTIENCLFRNCSATGGLGGGAGGAIRISEGSTPSFESCVFESNGSYFGGAVHASAAGDLVFTDCLFLGNAAYQGGAIYAQGGMVTLLGCTFADNPSTGATGVYLYGADGSVSSCTFFETGLGLSCPSTPVIENTLVAFAGVACGGEEPEFTCCDLYSDVTEVWVPPFDDQCGVNGNLEEAPRFCSSDPTADRNWTVYDTSPCVAPQSDCGQIGRWGVGCHDTPSERGSWATVKALYR